MNRPTPYVPQHSDRAAQRPEVPVDDRDSQASTSLRRLDTCVSSVCAQGRLRAAAKKFHGRLLRGRGGSPAERRAAQAAPPPPDLNVYVSPTGRDAGSGSAAHPFKTLDHARDYVRDVKQKAKGDIHVRLMSGTYRLSRTFALTARDSGRDGHRIVYEAAPGAHPVISGGERITGWVPADGAGRVYKAKVGDIDTRQLYVDGELETRARSGKNPPASARRPPATPSRIPASTPTSVPRTWRSSAPGAGS